jgi:F420-0:gamma-glutamyl ligase
MKRTVGTVVRGIRGPIINNGDNVAQIVTDCLLQAAEAENFKIRDKDVIAVTESVVARAQGNYATTEDIAADVNKKTGGGTIGLVFPILSRNRFSVLLRGFARGCEKIVIQLSYPADEVGNHLFDPELLSEKNINPWNETLTEQQFRHHFGFPTHRFTGIDYIAYYKQLVNDAGTACEIIFSNHPKEILNYASVVIACDVHTRARTKQILRDNGAEQVFGLDSFLNEVSANHGYNETYGLLGSNLATDTKVKLFPRDCQALVEQIRQILIERTGKTVEAMVYGDGAFKDPVGKIWELADPVVSPAYTKGLEGTPNEIKLKYLADNEFAGMDKDAQRIAIGKAIHDKQHDLKGTAASLGTTPRRIPDLLGSLCDLTSGSGDKGTPFVYIQGYFDNYADEADKTNDDNH